MNEADRRSAKPKDIKATSLRLLSYLKPYTLQFAVVIVFILLSSITGAYGTYFIGEELINKVKNKTIEVNIYDLCNDIYRRSGYILADFKIKLPNYMFPFKFGLDNKQIIQKTIKLYKANNDVLNITFKIAMGTSIFADKQFFIFECPIQDVKLNNGEELINCVEYNKEYDEMFIAKKIEKELIIKLPFNDKNFENDLFKKAFLNYMKNEEEKRNSKGKGNYVITRID